MLTQTTVPGTDDWWLAELSKDYGNNLPRMAKLKSYRDGTNAVPIFATGPMLEAYARFVERCRLNTAELITGARVNRMKPVGFRTAAAGDVNGDGAAMATWKRSNMKVGARTFLSDMCDYGTSYLTVTGPLVPSADASPLMLRSNGWSTVTRQNSAMDWITDAMLQVAWDPISEVDVLTLFRAGTMRQAFRDSPRKSSIPSNGQRWSLGRGWGWASDPIPLGYTDSVPGVRLDGPGGMGVYEKHLGHLDRINENILNRSTIIAMQAFRQRAIKGDLPEVYPDDDPLGRGGRRLDYNEIYKAGPAALWTLPEGAEIWESTTTDITPVLGAEAKDLKDLAAVSSTPLYVVAPDAASGSAEGASLAREQNGFSVEDLKDRADGAFALAHGFAFQALGDQVRAQVGEISTIWASTEHVSMNDRASAASQAKAGGLPQRMVDEKVWGLAPDEIAQAAQDRQDDAFLEPVEA